MCYRLRELYTSLLGGAQSPVKNEGHAWVTRCVSLQEMQYCGKTGTSRTVKKLSELFTQMAAAKPDKEKKELGFIELPPSYYLIYSDMFQMVGHKLFILLESSFSASIVEMRLKHFCLFHEYK